MTKTTKKPAFDPQELLRQLEGIVSKNKEPTKGGGKTWRSGLIIVAVVLVGLLVWYWVYTKRGRELAKLRHEKNKAKILKEDALWKMTVSKNDAVIASQEKKFEIAAKKQREVEVLIRAEEGRYEADLRAINSIRSWRDAGIR